MNRSIITSSAFLLLGAAAGFLGGYYFSKNKYLAMAEKEIDSVRKVYEKHFSSKTEQAVPIAKEETKNPVPVSNPDKEKYVNYTKMYNEEATNIDVSSKSSIGTSSNSHKKVNTTKKVPYVITPDEFNDSDYEVVTLMYYSDKVLADEDDNVIHDVNGVIGPEALSTFGRYLDDTVYVRDDLKRIDYEIIWDTRKYSSVVNILDDKDKNAED